jgi:hypothetical protein
MRDISLDQPYGAANMTHALHTFGKEDLTLFYDIVFITS